MTQDTLVQPALVKPSGATHSMSSSWANDGQSADFDYTPVSPWGVVAGVLGLTSLTAFLGVFGIGIACIALVVSLAAFVRIRGSQGTVRGYAGAIAGLLLSLVCIPGGIYGEVHAYNTEVPEGYQRVSFPEEISARQFQYPAGQRRLHPEVGKLIETKIFLKGFMYFNQQGTDLASFVLLKDNGDCCFGGKAQPYDMIQIDMTNGQTVDGHTGLVSVSGILRANVTAGEDEAVYVMDAHQVEPSKSRF